MFGDVVADDVKIVSEGSGDDFGAVEIIALTVAELLDVFNEVVKHYQEDGP